jgi:hypothetical protein
MGVDVLILNSGAWLLHEELPASPWFILIYRDTHEPRNELHLWLPRQDSARSGDYAFRRFWVDEQIRWCVELPEATRIRFTSPEGRTLWAACPGARGLGDLSDYDLSCLLAAASAGSYSGA